MKIIDTFIFYNELEMLKFRLTELNEHVDYFVLVEMTKTFAGNDKELYYDSNKEMFSEFNDKIIHIVVTPPENLSAWNNEYFQRNSIMKGLDKLDLIDDDIILIHDTDEIPDIDNILTFDIEIIKKGMRSALDTYYYNLNNKIEEHSPCGIVCSYSLFKNNNTPQNLRSSWNTFYYSYKGWHFSYFGDEYFISNKIKNFAHQEYNDDFYTDVNRIKNIVENNKDLYDRGKENGLMRRIELSDYLPKNYKMLLK
jgi:beta-1,4-mannosyl-glycoprotein beta-1,4-N-acetylglucosaminyltransferase